MNRRMKTERDVTTFVPVRSRVAGMRLHHPQGTKRAQAKIRNRAAMRRISLNALFAAFLPPAIGTGLIFGGIFSACDGLPQLLVEALGSVGVFLASRGFHRSARRWVAEA